MRDSTIIYRSFFEAIKELPIKNQGEVWNAVFEYSLNFNEVTLTGLSKTIFTLIKPQLDANIKRYKNGTQPKQKLQTSELEAKDKQEVSETEANLNVNDNVNVNDNPHHNSEEGAGQFGNPPTLVENYERIKTEWLESFTWITHLCKTKKLSEEKIKEWMVIFLEDQMGRENVESPQRLKDHFVNCLNKGQDHFDKIASKTETPKWLKNM